MSLDLSPEQEMVRKVERYLRDAKVAALYEGTTQIQKLIIGRFATDVGAFT